MIKIFSKSVIDFIKMFFKREFWRYLFSGKYIIKLEKEHLLTPLFFMILFSLIACLIPYTSELLHISDGKDFLEKFLLLFKNHWFYEISVIIILVFFENIKHQINIEKIEKGKFRKELFDLIDNTINASRDGDNLCGIDSIKEKIHYLQYVNQQIGKSLAFEPDSDSINMLQETNGMISITEAEPIKWQNPTYNFFLINNLLISLSNKINKYSKFNSIEYADSDQDPFKNYFLNDKESKLIELSKLNDIEDFIDFFKENPSTFRFYWITEEKFKLNKNIIELLIAYHNLFGSYIVFINRELFKMHGEVASKSRLKTIMNYHGYDFNANNGETDLAFGIDDKEINIIFRKDDRLCKEALKNDEKESLLSFIKELTTNINNDKEEPHKVLYFTKLPNYFTKNEKYCHLYIKEEDNANE